MAAPRSLSRFYERVRLFVALVVTYLLVLQGLAGLGLYRAHRRLEQAFVDDARSTARAVVSSVGLESLRDMLRQWNSRGQRARLPVTRNFLADYGLSSVELLTPEGWGMEASVRSGNGEEPLRSRDGFASDLRTQLRGGEIVVDLEAGLAGAPAYAVVRCYAPVRDVDAHLLGVVSIDLAAEPLATSRRDLRFILGIQTGATLAFLGLLVFFLRWMLRPIQLLDRTAHAPDMAVTQGLAQQDETGFVIDTYQKMIDQLREKEQELRRLREVERHRADELQDLNASIVDSMVSGVLVLDLSGRIRSANEAARETLRLGEGRVLGRSFRDVLAHLPELHDRLQRCLDEGLVLRRDEARLNLASVGRRDVGLTLSPLRDREGNRTGALFLVVDLTEIKRLQEQVRLRESLADLGELSAGVAHEFRNSLATMLGFATLIEREATGNTLENARAIHDEVKALRRVVDDFLRFANPTRLVLETIDLGEVFTELRSDVETRAAGKKVSYEAAAGLPTITGDDTLLRRVFTNLLRNAVDAVAEGGRVAVSSAAGEGEVVIHVDDDGPGIAPADREKIFVPFYTRKERGTGLGLALARKVVLHHGGRITVETSPLGGARFSVTLPFRPDRAA